MSAADQSEPLTFEPPPLPGRSIVSQRWRDVAFVHWRVEPGRIRHLIPEGLRPDVIDGSSWVGLVALRMTHTAPLRTPAIPWLGDLAETNVRLYTVDPAGRRGVLFLSMDASRLPLVLAARASLGLPYCWAQVEVRRSADRVSYTVRRRWPSGKAGARLVVRPGDDAARDVPLTAFLTARWRLHVRRAGRLLALPLAHEPWPLREASIESLDQNLVSVAGLAGVADSEPDSVLWSPGVRTEFGRPYDATKLHG